MREGECVRGREGRVRERGGSEREGGMEECGREGGR